MATKGDIKQAVYDECRGVLSGIDSVPVPHGASFDAITDPDAHLGPTREETADTYPYVAFEEFSETRRNFGGYVYVDEKTYANGSVDSITFGKDERLQFDIYVEVDRSEGQKDALYEALKSQFETYLEVKRPVDFHSDVDDMMFTDTQNADRMADGVRGDRLRLRIDYSRYETYTDIPTMETIEVDFEVDDVDVDEIDYDVIN